MRVEEEEGAGVVYLYVCLCDHVCAGKSLGICSGISASQMGLVVHLGQSKFTRVCACMCVHLSVRCAAYCEAKGRTHVFSMMQSVTYI